jgi:hypothetical protein
MVSETMEDMETASQNTSSSSFESEAGAEKPCWQSTLRITHPALLAAAQYNPSMLLASAPFAVLGEAPPNFGSTEDLENSDDSGSSEEVESMAESESLTDAKNAAGVNNAGDVKDTGSRGSHVCFEPPVDMESSADVRGSATLGNGVGGKWTDPTV